MEKLCPKEKWFNGWILLAAQRFHGWGNEQSRLQKATIFVNSAMGDLPDGKLGLDLRDT